MDRVRFGAWEGMNRPMTQTERRKAVRVPAKLAMEIQIGDVERAKVESVNVSANGVYFSSPRFIPELTRLVITLDLPAAEMGGPAGNVVCDGVVVRTDPEREVKGQSEYQVACFFTGIDDGDRETLESYILRQVDF